MLNIRKFDAMAVVLALCILIWTSAAEPVEVPTLYTAQVPLDNAADDPRQDAYRMALREVLMRVSGSELGSDPNLIEQLIPDPDPYVTQFRRGEEETMWVSFDGPALEQILRRAGFTVWGNDRPATIVWLAVDWGQGKREIIGADDPDRSIRESRSIDRNRLLRERMLEIAAKRGVPILFPLLDTTDLQSVTFSDIWGGFDQRVLAASRRYDVNSVVIGRIRPSSAQRNRWTYFFGDKERSWSGPPEAVVGQIADLLAAEFAIGGNEPLEFVELNVSGIHSVDAFGSVHVLLNGLDLIENYRVREVAGDTVSYHVEVRGGAARLRRALLFVGLIEQDLNDPTLGLEFFYSPQPGPDIFD